MKVIVDRIDFGMLFDVLRGSGYTVVGPTVSDQAIIYEEISSVDELPIGWTDEQSGGHYRLHKREDAALFGYVVGPQSWKKFLHPPRVKLLQAKRNEDGTIAFTNDAEEPPDYAFIGVRSCELHAIAIQDRVFLQSGAVDQPYANRRKGAFTVAVNCGQAGGTCFCVSMKTGPKVCEETPYDIALTELLDEDQHQFLMSAQSQAGRDVLKKLPSRPATLDECQAAEDIVARTATQMGRTMNADGVKELLYENFEHPRWDDVAERCLTCANCTMVCPTCFCTTVEDVTDLTGENAERWRSWDSCFTLDFTHMHGGSARQTAKSRYRQWMTHKLATWQDQFGSSGCVGCGRCIAWCPVGIDITEEIAAIRES